MSAVPERRWAIPSTRCGGLRGRLAARELGGGRRAIKGDRSKPLVNGLPDRLKDPGQSNGSTPRTIVTANAGSVTDLVSRFLTNGASRQGLLGLVTGCEKSQAVVILVTWGSMTCSNILASVPNPSIGFVSVVE
jgi:hypothetical protein